MIKQMLLISAIIGISGCETTNIKSQCNPEKNYVYSNPKMMEDYKNKTKNSIYFENSPITKCNSDNFCLYFEDGDFDFIEKKLNYLNKVGDGHDTIKGNFGNMIRLSGIDSQSLSFSKNGDSMDISYDNEMILTVEYPEMCSIQITETYEIIYLSDYLT